MRKGILLLGSMLMIIASPLYADIFSKNNVASDSLPAAFRLQMALSPFGQITGWLSADTQDFSILDTHGPLNTMARDVIRISSVAPAAQTINPSAPVPEPVHYALMGLGLVGLYLARRDRLSAK